MRYQQWLYRQPSSHEEIPTWRLPGGILPPELVGILMERGYSEATASAFLSPQAYIPSLPDQLPDMENAAEAVRRLMVKGDRPVLVWGDFDVDGLTASALLLEGLTRLNISTAIHTPNRHGIFVSDLKKQVEVYHPALLITCDTGTSAFEALEYAKSIALPVIVLDHHELPPVLPTVEALVNPMRLTRINHSLRALSAVGIVYLLLQQIASTQKTALDFSHWLELVALGLLADSVPLVKDTRYLVQRGLEALRHSQRTGLVALCGQLQLKQHTLTEHDIYFQIAPALNALTRLDSPEKGLALLLTQEMPQAQALAAQAHGLKQRRRLIQRQTQEAAYQQLEKDPSLLSWEALVLSSANWEGDVLGAVASRLSEEYRKPVVLIAHDDEQVSASVRAPEGFPVVAALQKVSDLLRTYGGHNRAGGFSAAIERLPMLRRRLSAAFAEVKASAAEPVLEIDCLLSLERLTLDFAYQVRRLAPFGEGNPPPIFAVKDVTVLRSAKLGVDDQHRRLTIRDSSGNQQTVFWWDSADSPLVEGRGDLVYTLDISYFGDEPSLQVTLVDWQQAELPVVEVAAPIEIIDCRGQDNLQVLLKDLIESDSSLQVWAEGFSSTRLLGVPLSGLHLSESLLILTTPSSSERLQEAIKKVSPRRIFLFFIDPPIRSLDEFLRVLEGLCRLVIEKQSGMATLEQFVERLAQPEAVIRAGLLHLAEQGLFTVGFKRGGYITFDAQQTTTGNKEKTLTQFQIVWEEVAAYRRYSRRIAPDKLIR